jgi:hypothetical protein
MSTRLVIVPLRDEHIEMLAEFYRVAWQSTASPAEVAHSRSQAAVANEAEPGSPLPAAVAIQNGQIVGYCGTLAVRFWNGTAAQPAYWAKGLMVLPEFRNGPIGFMLLKEISKSAPLMGAFTVNPASNRLFGALGYRDAGPLPNRVKPLSLAGALGNIDPASPPFSRLSPVASLGLGLAQRTRLPQLLGAAGDVLLSLSMPRVARGLSVGTQVQVEAREIDALWNRVSFELPVATVRDARSLVHRYGDGLSNSQYRYATVRRAGELVALAVVRVPRERGDARLGGIRVAAFSDLLVAPPDRVATMAVISGAEQCARDLGADALWCSASASWMASTLARRGYVSIASNVHFFLRAPTGDASWVHPVTSWWLMRGDSEADGNF